MKKERNYGKMLHNDAKIILITIFISIICEIIFKINSNYDYFILIALNIVAICYDTNSRKKKFGRNYDYFIIDIYNRVYYRI